AAFVRNPDATRRLAIGSTTLDPAKLPPVNRNWGVYVPFDPSAGGFFAGKRGKISAGKKTNLKVGKANKKKYLLKLFIVLLGEKVAQPNRTHLSPLLWKGFSPILIERRQGLELD